MCHFVKLIILQKNIQFFEIHQRCISKSTKNQNVFVLSFYNFLIIINDYKKALNANTLYGISNFLALTTTLSATLALRLSPRLALRLAIVDFDDFPKIGNRQ